MIYYILVAVILLLPLLTNNLKIGKYLYFAVVTALLIFFAGFRHYTVGTDTARYVKYMFVGGTPVWEYTLEELLEKREWLFLLYRSIVKQFTDNYTWFLFPVAAFYGITVSRFVFKHSEYPALSFLIFLAMSYYAFSLTGMRQTICYTFIIWALDALVERRKLLCLLFILISSGFHITGLLFLVIFVVDLVPFNLLYLLGTGIASIFTYMFAPLFIGNVSDFLWGDDRYAEVEYAGGESMLLVIVAVAIASVFLHPDLFKHAQLEIRPDGRKQRSELQVDQLFVKMLLFSIPIQAMVLYQANIFRVAMMFHFPMMAIIPSVIKRQNDDYISLLGRLIVSAVLFLELFVFTFNAAGVMPYAFYWQ